jgi:ABC-type multidrug transport system permease subunit
MLVNVVFCSTGLGILIGCIFNELEVALNIAPLIFFPMMLFSGFYVNSDSVRDWIVWVEYMNPMRYALEGLVYNEFTDTNYVPNPIGSFNFTFGYWNCMLYLIIIGGGIRLFGYIALLINAKTT